MLSKIIGTTMPVLQVGLEPGETIVSEAGQLSWMTPNVLMQTKAFTAGASSIWGAVSRAFSGGGLFMTEFTAQGGQAALAFSAKVPGQIIEVQVAPGRSYMIHRSGFLCGMYGVELSTGFQRSLGAGLFGGDGFLLQRLGGAGTAWIELGGEIVTYDLTPGETLMVHPGHVGMFDDQVAFDIQMVPGIKNKLFGGDGFFFARLTGPGRIWLQSMTIPALAHALSPYLHGGSGDVTQDATAAVETGVAGAIIGEIFGRR
jgi:uncharacterized protein (TIGR00266 family)